MEDGLARCTLPIVRQNISFLQSMSISAIVNVSGEPLDAQVAAYLDESSRHVVVHNVSCDSRNMIEMEEWAKTTLELLFTTVASRTAGSPNSMVLLVGNAQDCIDCLLIACMRRVQDWALVSILNEFRLLQGPLQQKSLDAEQFIEYFDVAVIDSTSKQPDFILIHRSLLREEEALFARLQEKRAKARIEAVDEEVLGRLLFSPPSLIFSASPSDAAQQFDPALSIVTDDKDDD